MNSTILSRRMRFQDQKKSFTENPSQFLGILSEADVLNACLNIGLEFRDRIYNPFVTLWLFTSQVIHKDHSCRAVVIKWVLSGFRNKSKKAPSSNTAAFCKARNRLPEELIKSLAQMVAGKLVSSQPKEWLWKNREIKLIDGTTFSMPDTKNNQALFPQQKGQKEGLGFPILRVVGIFSLSCGALIDASISSYQGKGSGENSLLKQIMSSFNTDDIVVADRCYSNYNTISYFLNRRVDFISRQNATRKMHTGSRKRINKQESYVYLKKPWQSEEVLKNCTEILPDEICVREIKTQIKNKGFRTKEMTIVTTLLDAETYTAEEIKDLYRQRWNVELNFRSLKSEMNMNILTCHTPENIKKEIWIYFLAYNMVRSLMSQVAYTHNYQVREISFKASLQAFDLFQMNLFINKTSWTKTYENIINILKVHRVGNRPNRYEPRARKRRPDAKKAFLLVPRAQAKKQMCAA